ncbi:Non-heme dioxygenase N-terminal domain-containing protein [Artemisia annua]|uniref:Non-heme dioxygenase N-terminal domain-containing protein n=1 Tax=Artemisia annua TaxID=35608 RepID=A0A2U1KZ79_ARTAN|nr:Non-heme dioxygenase N-terminal domain-containing protein [Artemisia annua]
MAAKVISSGFRYTSLPESYVRPVTDRPNLSQVSECDDVPVIDIGCGDRELISKQIGDACRHYGFFQVINHGVPDEIVKKMQQVGRDFFELPLEEKMKLYSEDPTKTMRLSTSFNVQKEKVHNWRDYLRLHCHPLDKYSPEWPSNPAYFKEYVGNYVTAVRDLGMRVLESISESLGLEKDRIIKILGDQGQHMAINHYPVCPEPELTFGLPGHTDPNALTILLQDTLVSGLQVLKDGKWVAVKPHPNAFVINIGDQLEAVSNGQYKSVWHRAVVNSDKPRMSIASFLCPCNDSILSAPKELIKDGSKPVFKDFTYAEYYKKFWSRNLDQEQHCLEFFKN